MILNPYAVLDACVSLLRLGIGLLVVVLALLAWNSWRSQGQLTEGRQVLENRCYLVFLFAGKLLALNVLAWPIFYLLLQSYVVEWPGVMCIYGVTRVGADSIGSSRFLPYLLAVLGGTKPILVFCSGVWFVLYLLNRSTRTAPLTGRVLLLVFATSWLAIVDAAIEIAYLVIPKKEEFLATGCCTATFATTGDTSRFVPGSLLGGHADASLFTAYGALNVATILALGGCVRWCRPDRLAAWLAPLLILVLCTLVTSAVFLSDVAAPRLLHMPNHHCPYDLISRAPASVLAVVLFLGGSFCAGWGCMAGWLGNPPEAKPFVAGAVRTLFRLGILGYIGSLLTMSIELALA